MYRARSVRLVVLTSLLSLVAASCLSGCGGYIVVDSSEELVEGPARTLESETVYTVKGVALANDELAITLDRQCNEVREIETHTKTTEHREYRTTGLWWTVGGVAVGGGLLGLTIYMIGQAEKDEAEFFGDCEPGMTSDGFCNDDPDPGGGLMDAGLYTAIGGIGVAAIIAGVAAYYEFADHDLERLSNEQVRRVETNLACDQPWPTGKVSLMAAHANQSFEGRTGGDGRISVPVSDATRDVWISEEPLQLALPDSLDWVPVTVPSTVRTALLSGSNENAERVYVWYEADDKYKDLLKAGTERVQGRLTGSRRYQFLSDNATRATIEKAVDAGGGNADARRQSALEAAQAENIKKVVQISITPLFETQVQLSFAVFNTSTGDQIYTTQAAADLKDALAALEVFNQLADAYLAWETQ